MHILIMHLDDAPDLAGTKNSSQKVQSWSSSNVNQNVYTQLTGESLENSQPIAHWQDFGVLTNHNRHDREAILKTSRCDIVSCLMRMCSSSG